MSIIDPTSGKETSATHAAYLSLREMLLTGALPAGEKLKIEQLRTQLDMGASPVCEALSLLTSDMLVERVDQRGFRAAPASLIIFRNSHSALRAQGHGPAPVHRADQLRMGRKPGAVAPPHEACSRNTNFRNSTQNVSYDPA